jgi:ATPase subunit of ABC transporter with duplicated ATPase domains
MGKKSYAEASQGKAAKIRDARIEGVRQWVRGARRALRVHLPLELALPELPPADGRTLVALEGVALAAGDRELLSGLDLHLARDRLAVIGPNGAGKSTLLSVIRGERAPSRGEATVHRPRLGGIAQGASDWLLDDSLVEQLGATSAQGSIDAIARVVLAHRFPLGLAQRPLASLSAGERVRAALLCLYQRAPELLVLDEPTYCLDFVGAAALVASLRLWRGGLVVASHDRAFLRAIGVTRCIELDGAGGHHVGAAVP